MEQMFLVAIGVSFVGFIGGLAGKAVAVKRKSRKQSELFGRITTFSLILMFILVIFYQFII